MATTMKEGSQWNQPPPEIKKIKKSEEQRNAKDEGIKQAQQPPTQPMNKPLETKKYEKMKNETNKNNQPNYSKRQNEPTKATITAIGLSS